MQSNDIYSEGVQKVYISAKTDFSAPSSVAVWPYPIFVTCSTLKISNTEVRGRKETFAMGTEETKAILFGEFKRYPECVSTQKPILYQGFIAPNDALPFFIKLFSDARTLLITESENIKPGKYNLKIIGSIGSTIKDSFTIDLIVTKPKLFSTIVIQPKHLADIDLSNVEYIKGLSFRVTVNTKVSIES